MIRFVQANKSASTASVSTAITVIRLAVLKKSASTTSVFWAEMNAVIPNARPMRLVITDSVLSRRRLRVLVKDRGCASTTNAFRSMMEHAIRVAPKGGFVSTAAVRNSMMEHAIRNALATKFAATASAFMAMMEAAVRNAKKDFCARTDHVSQNARPQKVFDAEVCAVKEIRRFAMKLRMSVWPSAAQMKRDAVMSSVVIMQRNFVFTANASSKKRTMNARVQRIAHLMPSAKQL